MSEDQKPARAATTYFAQRWPTLTHRASKHCRMLKTSDGALSAKRSSEIEP